MASSQVTPAKKPRRPPPRAMPPPGVDDNEGEWIGEKHCGCCTACLCTVFWPVACCPVDSRRIYISSRGVRFHRDGRKVSQYQRCIDRAQSWGRASIGGITVSARHSRVAGCICTAV